ncbi:MAG: threonine synthase [Christensenellales bacterium]
MQFVSTRGGSPQMSGMAAILQGLAPDGGLLMPASPLHLAGEPSVYAEAAGQALSAAFGEDYGPEALKTLAEAAYAPGDFDDPAIAPLRRVGPHGVLELFHGPTASFKDIALAVLPRLMALARSRLMPEREMLVLTATSGDTGSATMAGFRDIPGIRVIVFYPEGGVSPVQAAQMERMAGSNLAAVAIRGDFDQAQRGVKEIFGQAKDIAPDHLLSSANSINIGRLIPQMVYYLMAVNRPGRSGETVFAVPTGNFGDIFAGALALQAAGRQAGLLCATNANSVLHEALREGVYEGRRPLIKTLSPSMDILRSSNFERAVYTACEKDSALCRRLMAVLEASGRLSLPAHVHGRLSARFDSAVCSDEAALHTMGDVWREQGYLLDPHSACAWHALSGRLKPGQEGIALATASPFKFPAAALRALGVAVPPSPHEQMLALKDATGLPLPRALRDLFSGPVLHDEIIAVDAMADYVRMRARSW